MTLNVVCIKWGTKYSPDYVNYLGRALRSFLTIPHRFVCLTDDPRGIDPDVETKPFEEDLPGWWNKLALFKSRVHDIEGTILYLDLDMVIVRNIDALARHPGPFVAAPTFRRRDEYASAFLRFEVGGQARVWELFEHRAEDVIREVYGDQNWINACCTIRCQHVYTQRVRELWPMVTPDRCLIEAVPRAWFPDYRGELSDGPHRLTDEARVIVFHGLPRVCEVPWVAHLWRGDDRTA